MMNIVRNQLGGAALLIGLVVYTASCPAQAGNNEFREWKVVADNDLDTMRGGFVGSGGLEISLGIVKAVFVDGVLQTTSTLNIPMLGSLNGITPVQINNLQSNSAAFVQNTGNQIVVQNGANQKTIQNVTMLDATVNSISLIRDINLTSSINQQLRNALH